MYWAEASEAVTTARQAKHRNAILMRRVRVRRGNRTIHLAEQADQHLMRLTPRVLSQPRWRFARHANPITTVAYTHPSDEEIYSAIAGI
jgi:hypothetical protein